MLLKIPSRSGFTLVELLVAVSIIAVLSTIGLVSYQGIQGKARDSIKKQDLHKLAAALEIYFQANGKYITGSGNCLQNTASSTFYTDIRQYLNGDVPNDPKTNLPYCYEGVADGLNYALYAKLENCADANIIPEINCQTSEYNFSVVSE